MPKGVRLGPHIFARTEVLSLTLFDGPFTVVRGYSERNSCQPARATPLFDITNAQRFYLVLADLTLVVHAAFVAFVIVALALIWIGHFRHWAFVRNIWFRLAHLAAIGIVAAESVAGFVCPLTTWENRLRLLAGGEERYEGSFIKHWLHPLLFFDLNENVFTAVYLVFFLTIALSLWFVPPRMPRRTRTR